MSVGLFPTAVDQLDAVAVRILDEADEGTAFADPIGLAFRLDPLLLQLAELKEQGIEPEREPYRVTEGGSLICFVQDPDGYRLELIEKKKKV